MDLYSAKIGETYYNVSLLWRKKSVCRVCIYMNTDVNDSTRARGYVLQAKFRFQPNLSLINITDLYSTIGYI